MHKFVREDKHGLWQKITDTGQLDDESAAELEVAMNEFQKRYAGARPATTATA
jgi:hypothetical protein